LTTAGYSDAFICRFSQCYPANYTDNISVCGSYTWIDGVEYFADNSTATYTLTNAAGCDSVVTLNLEILQASTGVDEVSACGSYTWIDGVEYFADNSTATYTLTNAAGCDSVVTLNLEIFQASTGVDEVSSCGSYTWIDGVEYFTDNSTATYTLPNAVGCDSVVTLNLEILQASTGVDEVSACGSYTWIDGVEYFADNSTATYTLTNAAGCDSVVTLNLEILQASTGVDEVSSCGSYTWIDGIEYFTDNSTATYTLTNAAGCDSVVTLNLEIFQASTGVDEVSSCGSYTWIDGVEYFADNSTATYTLTNAVGCDSVVTLNLEILQASTGVDEVSACGSYTWIDGVEYFTDNSTATYTLTNAVGCDSVVTLNLEILQASTGVDEVSACGSYTWIDGVEYFADNSTATYTLTNAVGCDSMVTLNLAVLSQIENTFDQIVCDSIFIDPSGNSYTQSGVYTLVYPNENGCDSIVIWNLSFHTIDSFLIYDNETLYTVNEGTYNYTWLDCSTNSPIPGYHESWYRPEISGEYAVTINDGFCQVTSACISVLKEKIEIYPNPTLGELYIKRIGTEEMTIRIMDSMNKLIKSFKSTSLITPIFMGDVCRGTYLFEITMGSNVFVYKIIKQ
jgi:hypothetical protein